MTSNFITIPVLPPGLGQHLSTSISLGKRRRVIGTSMTVTSRGSLWSLSSLSDPDWTPHVHTTSTLDPFVSSCSSTVVVYTYQLGQEQFFYVLNLQVTGSFSMFFGVFVWLIECFICCNLHIPYHNEPCFWPKQWRVLGTHETENTFIFILWFPSIKKGKSFSNIGGWSVTRQVERATTK